jgi:uncharacterized membrane protein
VSRQRLNIPSFEDLPGATDAERTGRQLALAVYALQAASFVVGITFLVGVVVNYLKRDSVAGTWVASHFRWQIRTFWYGLLWGVLGVILSFVVIGYAVIFVNMLWIIYRIVRGALRLADGRPMYAETTA